MVWCGVVWCGVVRCGLLWCVLDKTGGVGGSGKMRLVVEVEISYLEV